MSGSKDLEQFQKSIAGFIDGWGKKLSVIAKQLKELQDKIAENQAQIDKMEALRKEQDTMKKQRDAILKGVYGLSDDLQGQIIGVKPPPSPDPKQVSLVPKFITDRVSKEGLKLGDYGALKPDVDVDLKKVQVKKFVLTWTFHFK